MHDEGWKRVLGYVREEKKMLKEKNNLFYEKRKKAYFIPTLFSFIVFQVTKHFMRFLEASRKDQSYK